jgi:hypothetical protein
MQLLLINFGLKITIFLDVYSDSTHYNFRHAAKGI